MGTAADSKPKATEILHTRIVRVVRVLYTLFFIFMLFSSPSPVLIVHICSKTHDLYHETPVVYTYRSAATVIHTGEYGGMLYVLISQPPAARYTVSRLTRRNGKNEIKLLLLLLRKGD